MLTVNKLEKIIELEDSLRAEYQEKLDAKSADVERLQQELADLREQMQGTIDTQLEKIASLSEKASSIACTIRQDGLPSWSRKTRLTRKQEPQLESRSSGPIHSVQRCTMAALCEASTLGGKS